MPRRKTAAKKASANLRSRQKKYKKAGEKPIKKVTFCTKLPEEVLFDKEEAPMMVASAMEAVRAQLGGSKQKPRRQSLRLLGMKNTKK